MLAKFPSKIPALIPPGFPPRIPQGSPIEVLPGIHTMIHTAISSKFPIGNRKCCGPVITAGIPSGKPIIITSTGSLKHFQHKYLQLSVPGTPGGSSASIA